MKVPGLDKLRNLVQGDSSSGKKADAVPKSPSPLANTVNQEKPAPVKVKKFPTKSPSFLDRLSSLFKGNKGKGAKPKAVPTSTSHATSPPASTGSQEKPAAVKVKKSPTKSPSFLDQLSSLFKGNKRKGTKPKAVPKSPSPDTSLPASTGYPVKSAAATVAGDNRKGPSLFNRTTGLFHHGKGKGTQPGTGVKTPAAAPATQGLAGDPQQVPDLLPGEIELTERKKTSTLDPLKRVFHVESEMEEKGPSDRRDKAGKSKKAKKIILQYDPVVEGPLVESALPAGYQEIDHYWSDVGVSLVVIALNEKTNQNEYLLFEPILSEFQYELIERVHADLRNVLILDDDDELAMDKRELLLEKTNDLFREYGINPDLNTLFKLQYYLVRNFLGWGRIEALMNDPYIEDISCDGTMIPLFLYHRKYRNIKTNIKFKAEILDSLAITLAQRSGKHISTGSPIIDATLPEGSRLQLTFGKEVTTRGTSFTIRKFREEPFSPIELLMNGTFNEDQLVYFWMAIENNKSLLFIGGTASGKTTSLNATSLFIPPMAKVVSIEDTREITLFHENWIASVTRDSIAEGASMISMFDLLRAAMRQRPEYILVGEVRGVEAQTLFQAMNTGHTTFSTLHAGNVDAAIHRLESEPLNVPRNMLQALNVICVQALVYRGQERIRRVQEIVEIAGADPITGSLRVNTVFTYDPVTDQFSYHGRSQVYADIAQKRGWSREQLEDEIRVRKIILVAMKDQGILNYISASQLFQAYNIDPAGVIEALGDLKAFLSRGV
ncbi:MAG: type II/IV secretion system ATPase subunit [Methanomicrobiales archaeon]